MQILTATRRRVRIDVHDLDLDLHFYNGPRSKVNIVIEILHVTVRIGNNCVRFMDTLKVHLFSYCDKHGAGQSWYVHFLKLPSS